MTHRDRWRKEIGSDMQGLRWHAVNGQAWARDRVWLEPRLGSARLDLISAVHGGSDGRGLGRAYQAGEFAGVFDGKMAPAAAGLPGKRRGHLRLRLGERRRTVVAGFPGEASNGDGNGTAARRRRRS